MSAQKPERLRGGVAVPVGAFALRLARLDAAMGAAEFVDVGTGIASVVMLEREEQGAPLSVVTLRKLTHASRVRMERVAVWRNWQTQQTQNLPELCSVWVQVPPPPPGFPTDFSPGFDISFSLTRLVLNGCLAMTRQNSCACDDSLGTFREKIRIERYGHADLRG